MIQVQQATDGTQFAATYLLLGLVGPVQAPSSALVPPANASTGLFGDEMTQFSFCLDVVASVCVHLCEWQSRLRIHAAQIQPGV